MTSSLGLVSVLVSGLDFSTSSKTEVEVVFPSQYCRSSFKTGAGKSAAKYILKSHQNIERIQVETGSGIRYALPHYISCDTDLELSIRVVSPGENISIGFFDGTKLVKTKKFRKVHPAQMIKIKLKRSDTKAINTLRVEVLSK